MARLQSTDTLLYAAVIQAIAALKLDPDGADLGAVKLAREYAAAIDNAPDDERATVLAQLGPKLLDALEALGATPRARARKESARGARPGKLATIRASRTA